MNGSAFWTTASYAVQLRTLKRALLQHDLPRTAPPVTPAFLPLAACSPAQRQVPSQNLAQVVKLSGAWEPLVEVSNVTKPRPLVIWHGLGDSYNSPGILEFIARVKTIHPGIFVHSIYLADALDDDRRATFYGNVNEQVEQVAAQLANITEIADGFDAMGFSQGGQFLRAYIERHNAPPVHNLITFGSQHMGISDIPGCRPFDVMCQLARRAALHEVYTEWAQKQLVQAQYFRDPARLDPNFASLTKLVLVLFLQDETVVPKESSWFGAYAVPNDSATEVGAQPQEKTVVPMRLQPLYIEDWIGLRTLDKRGAVVLETCEGEHMVLTDDCWQPLVRRFVGGETAEPESADLELGWVGGELVVQA
ncbi:Alpha/Beta hydrolase protein [Fomitopsis serialis]|uniref:Alpha/Beta hydrolase protein n=1 Tax=Fomitopsis serialis TaxID=139415 RepID=UPI0020074FAB|nr:Alpha/Beta hydrolase protein [Neoantrodia serialis]KAH9924873.1 Alpha/Beta hydrolase protein [Neoantrodia serialis]